MIQDKSLLQLRVNCSDQLSYRGKSCMINLIHYKSSGIYFARFRVKSKLIRRTMNHGNVKRP